MGAGATVAARIAAEDMNALSTTAVLRASETLPFSGLAFYANCEAVDYGGTIYVGTAVERIRDKLLDYVDVLIDHELGIVR